MKKAILLTSLMVSALGQNLFGQADYSSYCSTTRTEANVADGGGVKSVSFQNGIFTAIVDTVAAAPSFFSWSVDQPWLGGRQISDSVFTLKVKSSFACSFRIGVVSDGYSKTYDVPFATNKMLVGGADYVDYSISPSGTTLFNGKKFQQIIFYILPTSDVVMGTLSVKDLSYGTNGCTLSAVNNARSNVSQIQLFPNPSNGNEVNVDATFNKPTAAKVMVSNLVGQTVYTSNEMSSDNFKQTLPVSAWAKGVYNVTVVADGVPMKTEMLVVQ